MTSDYLLSHMKQ